MASSLSNLVNNLAEGIYKIKRKYGHAMIKNVQVAELNAQIVSSFLKT